jgi:hypothetical protein
MIQDVCATALCLPKTQFEGVLPTGGLSTRAWGFVLIRTLQLGDRVELHKRANW